MYLIIKVSIVDQKENNENGGSDHIGITMDGSMDAVYSTAHTQDSLTLPLVLVAGRRVSFKLQSRVCVYIAMSRVGLFCFFVDCAGDISFICLESTEKKQRRLTRRRCNGCGFLARDCAALVLTGVVAAAATCSRRRMPCGTLSMATL